MYKYFKSLYGGAILDGTLARDSKSQKSLFSDNYEFHIEQLQAE